jgi:hypothetical protein
MHITTDKEKLSKTYLEDHLGSLDEQVDVDHCAAVEDLQLKTFGFRPVSRLPVLVTMRDDVAHKSVSHGGWPAFTFDHMWNDYGAMLLNELQTVYESVSVKDDKVFTIRPNLSQIVVPSLFGAEGSFSRKNEDSMPSVHIPPSKEELLERITGNIDFENHWTIVKYREVIEAWEELLVPFPRLKKTLHFCLPDLQGPFNLFFLLRGEEAYVELHTDPDFVHRVMEAVTETLIDITNYLASYLGQGDYGYYWNYVYPGKVRNVDDNSILISREQYKTFVHPYNKKLTQECGGGIHHYCGNGDHVIDFIIQMDEICGLNFGNPEKQDWEFVYNTALKNQVVLLWDRPLPANEFKKLDRGVIMKVIVSSLDEARKTVEEYKT